MKFENHLSYQNMVNLTSPELGRYLSEIKNVFEKRLDNRLSKLKDSPVPRNIGAVDKKNILYREKRNAYFSTVDEAIHDLHNLGHYLVPLDHDVEINFESNSVCWGAADNLIGLDLEIFPSKVHVSWVVQANA